MANTSAAARGPTAPGADRRKHGPSGGGRWLADGSDIAATFHEAFGHTPNFISTEVLYDLRTARKRARWPGRTLNAPAWLHPQFSNPDANFNSTTFGVISSTAVSPGIGQLALRFTFLVSGTSESCWSRQPQLLAFMDT